MKEVVILSGKGGVGKSSLAASLAVLAARNSKVLLTDTDVDAPNLDLVLGAKLRGSEQIAASVKAFVDYDKCLGCMRCRDVCKFAAVIGDEQPIIIPYSCEGCGACAISCPADAIEIKEVVNGQLNLFDAGGTLLVAGALHIGESSSGRLVDTVKKRARLEAEKFQVETVITDGPPGIGCPVIASVKGADYVVLVTEPTPAGLNDLQRVIEVVRHFQIPLGIVLNKADIHLESNRTIKKFARNNGFSILAEIPYDKSMSLALAKAQPVVCAYPAAPAALAICTLAGVLEKKLNELPGNLNG
ncbi:MinD superfamily P-loop ATPase, contains an inserted ferredoxin domain [Malonomonas rubra DSM 5091]|uniref:MinD superfamily P-loop ATPase, contains an inserted ferredoxin domain n=1 Tax=Malonomonas rubra DSM 5091 TaxID=1122189 RepID=A0A1M6NEV2_MALRU|nr:ATP-binding protein [Malonomonas rubra]SHJ94230.1 MinD superfamily P-loop ATPase, contains an inserted ferredoxin domain [Malonomonas rubra DSM 5091]